MVRCDVNNCKNHKEGWCRLITVTVSDNESKAEEARPVCMNYESIMSTAEPEE